MKKCFDYASSPLVLNNVNYGKVGGLFLFSFFRFCAKSSCLFVLIFILRGKIIETIFSLCVRYSSVDFYFIAALKASSVRFIKIAMIKLQ